MASLAPPISSLMIDWTSAAASFQRHPPNILAFGADIVFITLTHDTAKYKSMISSIARRLPSRQVQVADHS